MPKQRMSWSIYILILIHIASLIFFIYTYFRTPPAPPILALNLDERADRWHQIQQEFAHWTPSIERVSAVKYSPGWKGCTLSHRKAVEIAKTRNYPWVLIIEDDCMLTPDAHYRFQTLLPYLWKHRHRWDIFMGGLTWIEDPKRISKNPLIFQAKGHTSHFCLIHKATYNTILHHIPNDPKRIHETEIIDVWYKKHMRLWTTVPFLAVQRPSKSDIENRSTDYTDSFQTSAAVLQRLA